MIQRSKNLFALFSLAATGIVLCTAAASAVSSEEADHAGVQSTAVEGRVLGAGPTAESGAEPATANVVPMAEVFVYAFEVATRKLERVRSDESGRFFFDRLPAGMYKLVAFKPGFVPTVELLLRRSERDEQFVELRLRQQDQDPSEPQAGDEYWSVRSRVPADVLREIHGVRLAGIASERAARDGGWGRPMPVALELQGNELFETEMRALSGVQGAGAQRTQSTLAEVGVRGAVGDVQVGVDGSFQQLSSADQATAFDGQVRSVAFQMDATEDQRLRLTTSQGQLGDTTAGDAVDLRRYQVDWSGKAGAQGETRVSASYVEESNYHLSGWLDPVSLPGASQTWNLAGSYHGSVGATSLDAGMSYRQRALLGATTDGTDDGIVDESIGLYGVANTEIAPKVLVEYGLFSSVRDGSLSLMPHGGIVIELGDGWRARSSVAHRVEDEELEQPFETFDTAFFTDKGSCHRAGEACYEVFLSRGQEDDEITVGAVHREYADTLRVYFSPDFFDRLESLFVVEGDRLPEVQFSMSRRITPKVLAKLESNYASGGGGIFYATDDAPYENQVRYLVTSLDTQFQQTSTGVFVAFHHLEQSLSPMASGSESDTRGVEMQSLQLMLTQDLSALVDLASRWAVRLNMEVSRGATPYTLTHDDEMYKKLSGGFSVSF